MTLIVVDPLAPDPRVIEQAAAILRAGRLVAFPTETVYGLGANALDRAAVERIYVAKGRPSYNPLIVHVARTAQALELVTDWPDTAAALANAFWPGPLTLVLPKRDSIPDAVTAGLASVAVRVPRHPVARALLVAANIPIAAPSANRSMAVSPTTGAHVAKSLGDAVDLILDAGPTDVGIESTVIDLAGTTPTLLRPGTISVAEVEFVIGPIDLIASLGRPENNESSERGAVDVASTPRRSPGMLDKHYSPRARVIIVDAPDARTRLEREQSDARTVGAIVMRANVELSPTIVRLPLDAAGYAARMYDALHALDDAGCDVIVVERVPDSPAWLGVRDRLERAAR